LRTEREGEVAKQATVEESGNPSERIVDKHLLGLKA
jgi:hypothetical protein